MRDSYEIRFDKHGNMIIEDPELERRILYLLKNDRQIVMRLRTDERVGTPGEPNYIPDPTTDTTWVKPINLRCPNAMCVCGLKVINELVFTSDWNTLGKGKPGAAREEL